jgi:hypothetical protein
LLKTVLCTVLNGLFYLEFTFLTGFFDRILNQLVKPIVVKRRLVPDHRLNLEFQFVMARLTDVPVGHMEIITSHDGGGDDTLTNITGKGLHKQTP